MSLHLHRAEQADVLVGALGEVLAVPLADPFATKVVCVSTPGVERWIAQRLAHGLGAAAGTTASAPGSTSPPPPASWRRRSAAPARTTLGPVARRLAAARRPRDRRRRAVGGGARRPPRPGHGPGPDDPDDTRRSRRWSTARRVAGLFARYAADRPRCSRTGPPAATWDRTGGAAGGGPGLAAGALAAAAGPDRRPGRGDAAAPGRRAAPDGEPERWGRASGCPNGCRSSATPARPAPPRGAAGARRRPRGAPVAAAPVAGRLGRGSERVSRGPRGPVLPLRAADRPSASPEPAAGLPRPRPPRAAGADLGRGGGRRGDPGRPAPPRAGRTARPPCWRRLQGDLAAGPSTVGRPPARRDDRSVQVHACAGPHRQVEVLREVLLGLLWPTTRPSSRATSW